MMVVVVALRAELLNSISSWVVIIMVVVTILWNDHDIRGRAG